MTLLPKTPLPNPPPVGRAKRGGRSRTEPSPTGGGQGGGKTVTHYGSINICVQAHSAGEPIKVVASRSHSDERTAALLNQLGKYQCISMGSSLKLCLVAEGKAHFYPRLGPTMEWDTAAAHAVVNAAGGVVHDRDGKELTYNKPDLHNPEFFVFAATDKELPKLIKGFI